MKNNSGFTLAEVLLASSISVLVAMSILAIFLMSNRTWKEASANVTLQSNGRLILNQIAAGSHGRYGLREANYNALTVEDSGKSIRFVMDENEPPTYVETDDKTCRFYLSNNRVWYDPDTNVSRNEYPLTNLGKVEDIKFTTNTGYVNIELTMKDYGSNRADAYVKLTTNVFLRKARTVLQ